MGEFIGVIIFIVISVLSIAQKMKEQKALKNKLDREDVEERAREGSPPDEEIVQTAQPRRAQRPRTLEMPTDVEDVIRQLMGQAPRSPQPVVEIEEEGEWEAEPPPIRRELSQREQQAQHARQQQAARAQQSSQQRQQPPAQRGPVRPEMQRSARPERQRPARSPAEMMSTRQARSKPREESVSQEDIDRREKEQRWREESARRKGQEQTAQQQQQQQQRAQAGRPARRVAPTVRRRLFGNIAEVRRAIVLSEVINPPRALKDLEPRV